MDLATPVTAEEIANESGIYADDQRGLVMNDLLCLLALGAVRMVGGAGHPLALTVGT